MAIFEKIKKRLLAKIVILGVFVSILYGCGFHLRGWNNAELPKFMERVYISYSGKDYDFLNAMISATNAAGAKIAETKDNASVILQIKSAKAEDRLTGIIGGASANQYLLSFTVHYQLLDNKDHVIMADQFNAATSPYSSNATQQLSNDNQREQIYNNLKQQVANNIILQLQSIDPSVYEVKKHD